MMNVRKVQPVVSDDKKGHIIPNFPNKKINKDDDEINDKDKKKSGEKPA